MQAGFEGSYSGETGRDVSARSFGKSSDHGCPLRADYPNNFARQRSDLHPAAASPGATPHSLLLSHSLCYSISCVAHSHLVVWLTLFACVGRCRLTRAAHWPFPTAPAAHQRPELWIPLCLKSLAHVWTQLVLG